MNFIEQLTAVSLLVDFFLGVTFGVVGSAVHGSLREDKGRTLLRQAPDAVSNGARVIFGVYTRDDGYMGRLLAGGGRLPANDRDAWPDDDSDAKGRDPER
jgi:hypothetical protein